MEEALGITDPTPTDMLGLISFDASGKGIIDLTGLEYAVNLQVLDVHNSKINDISPLSELTNLQILSIWFNKINDISALSGLTGLLELELGSNRISDISALSGLTNLEKLELNGNRFNDILPLSELTSLLELRVGNNLISDISPLSGLTSLLELGLSSNQISDISALSGLTGLQYLHLGNNQIRSIPSLSCLKSLRIITLENNQINDISGLSGLTNLRELRLENNRINDLSPLAGLTNLRMLNLNTNKVRDISILSELTSLESLYLRDISPLSGLTNLVQLELNNNQISDISPLSELTNLKWLYLSGNQISDISLLTGFTNLIIVKIRANPLGIDAFNIHIIELQSNGIIVDYDPPIYTLSAKSTTGGSITAPGEGFYDFDHGTTVTLTAVPQLPHYRFVNWTGTAVDAGRVTDPALTNTTAIIYSDYTLQANFMLLETGPEENQTILYVDDDAPNDPGANDPVFSDPEEDGSQEHPYDTIQEGIDAAVDNEIVIVAPGTYTGDGNRDIDFRGKAITVKSEQGPATCIIDCQSYYYVDKNGIHSEFHRGFYFHNDEDVNSVVQGFTITNGLTTGHELGGGILCNNSSPRILDCIIVDNQARKGGGIGVINSNAQIIGCQIKKNAAYSGGGIEIDYQNDGIVLIKGCIISGNYAVFHPRFGGDGGGIRVCSYSNIVNCTITDNLAGYCGGGICFYYGAPVSNSIIWGNTVRLGDGNDIVLMYKCDSQRLLPHVFIEYSLVGSGNENDFGFRPDSDQCLDGQWLQGDPCFANTGYWDPNGTPDYSDDDFWVDGDYHLKSQAGRWDPNSQSWIQEDVTSPCIDAGDPNSPIGREPFPNGGIINIGAYGGTQEASKSTSTINSRF